MSSAVREPSSWRGAPAVLVALGALGVAPFWLPVLGGVIWPDRSAMAAQTLTVYAAVILSFLAGTRLGVAIIPARPAATTVCLAMAPPLVGWLLVLAPIPAAFRLALLAAALVAHAVWDGAARDTPPWYAGLRWRLTLAAVAGLLAGAGVLHG